MGSGKIEDQVLENLNKEILMNMRSKFPNLLIWAREHISIEIDSGISERKKNRQRKRGNFFFFCESKSVRQSQKVQYANSRWPFVMGKQRLADIFNLHIEPFGSDVQIYTFNRKYI